MTTLKNLSTEQFQVFENLVQEFREYCEVDEGFDSEALDVLREHYAPYFEAQDKLIQEQSKAKHAKIWEDLKTILLDPNAYEDGKFHAHKSVVESHLNTISLATWDNYQRIGFLYSTLVGQCNGCMIILEHPPLRYLKPKVYNVIVCLGHLSHYYHDRVDWTL